MVMLPIELDRARGGRRYAPPDRIPPSPL